MLFLSHNAHSVHSVSVLGRDEQRAARLCLIDLKTKMCEYFHLNPYKIRNLVLTFKTVNNDIWVSLFIGSNGLKFSNCVLFVHSNLSLSEEGLLFFLFFLNSRQYPLPLVEKFGPNSWRKSWNLRSRGEPTQETSQRRHSLVFLSFLHVGCAITCYSLVHAKCNDCKSNKALHKFETLHNYKDESYIFDDVMRGNSYTTTYM